MKRTWKKQYYKPGDENEIQELFKLAFGKEMGKTESQNHWQWEFRNNPNGKAEILLAVDKDKIVGQYAVIPQRMKIQDRKVIGTLSLDTMVHPAYQGQGIFTILASSLYKDIGKKYMPITYGFPNENSMHGIFTKLGWLEIAPLPVLQKTFNLKKVISKSLKSNILGQIGSIFFKKNRILEMPSTAGDNWKVDKLDRFDKEYDSIFDHGTKQFNVITIRDSKYLNWRYIEKPESDYKCFGISIEGQKYGYIVVKKEEKFDLTSGFIVDYFSRGNNLMFDTVLISWGTDYLSFLGVDIAVAMMFPHSPYYEIFRKLGFFKIPRKMFPKDIYFGARRNNEDVNFDIVCDKKNWYLTWGDTDVI